MGSLTGAVASSPKADMDDDYEPWRAKDDMRTLLEAERIKKDAKRLKNAKRAAKEQVAENKAIQSLAAT